MPHSLCSNPPLAYQAVTAGPDIGLLLPCNVNVREEVPGQAVVGFLAPQIMVNLVGKPEVGSVPASGRSRKTTYGRLAEVTTGCYVGAKHEKSAVSVGQLWRNPMGGSGSIAPRPA